MNKQTKCIVCGGGATISFLRIEQAPVSCNHLCCSRNAALDEPKASISLHFCTVCGHVFNAEYDSAHVTYQPGYENSLRGSQRFREYDDALIDSLLSRYDLHGHVIVEIGCGRGDFLRGLCGRGRNSGIGFDPSYSWTDDQTGEMPGVVLRSEIYRPRETDPSADFVCSRHTLEHLGEPRKFLSTIRSATDRGVPIFFEVPNGLYSLRDGGIWDIIYEHCSYFTPSSLARLFNETGYEVVEVAETFGGQFLTVHARTGACSPSLASANTSNVENLVRSFRARYRSKLTEWSLRLQKLARERRSVVVWGAGAKTATFLNLLRPKLVEYVVDVNPRKHDHYMIGTGQRIVPPHFLIEYPTDEIICLNPNYVDEIACQIQELGLRATLVSA